MEERTRNTIEMDKGFYNRSFHFSFAYFPSSA